MRRTFPHDVLNVHFYSVFRQAELRGNQLVRKAELQRRKHLLLAGRKVDHCLFGYTPRGAVTLVDCG